MERRHIIAAVAGLALLLLGCFAPAASAQTLGEKPFVTRWTASTNGVIRVPLKGDYAYKWHRVDGTGTPVTGVAHVEGDGTLELAVEAGEYELQAGPEGVIELRFRYRNAGSAYASYESLISVERWGDVVWDNLDGAFYACKNVTMSPQAGVPNLTQVTSMDHMLSGAEKFNSPLADWLPVKAKLIDLSNCGMDAGNLSATLQAWMEKRGQLQAGVTLRAYGLSRNEVGKAARNVLQREQGWKCYGDTPEKPTLDEEKAFVLRIKGHNLYGNVNVYLYGKYAYKLVALDGSGTTLSGIANVQKEEHLELPIANYEIEYELYAGPDGVQYMREDNRNWTNLYLQSVERWGAVEWESFHGAFNGSQALQFGENAGVPDLRKVTSMARAFRRCNKLNQPMAAWDVSNVTTMESAFENCDAFNQPLDSWNVSGVTNMNSMFQDCDAFNQPLNSWDVSKVVDMRQMFAGAKAFNQPLGAWDISSLENAYDMFYGSGFNHSVGSWRPSEGVGLYLSHSGFSVHSMSETLLAWAAQLKNDPASVSRNVKIYGKRCTASAKTAASKLKEQKGWYIDCDILKEPKPVESIAITNTPLPVEVELGRRFALTAEVKPYEATEKPPTWSSDKPEIAAVDPVLGIVEGKGLGEAIITVSQEGKEALCKVRVVPALANGVVPVQSVSLNQATGTLKIGQTLALQATVAPADATNKSVVWSSDQPTIASVADGVVTALSTGTAIITVTTRDGEHKAMCTVTVESNVKPGDVPVESVALNRSALEIGINQDYALVATITPSNATNQQVRWASDNPAVATVTNSGRVNGVAMGKATITVTTEEGGKTATCVVTVSFQITLWPVTHVTLDRTEATLRVGESLELHATVHPELANNKSVLWRSLHPTIASVERGKVTALAAGQATIQAISEEGAKIATCQITVQPADQATSVSSALLAGLSVAPNPFTLQLRISGAGHATSLKLVDMSGRAILMRPLIGSDEVIVNTSTIPAGAYILKIEAADGERSLTVVKE